MIRAFKLGGALLLLGLVLNCTGGVRSGECAPRVGHNAYRNQAKDTLFLTLDTTWVCNRR